MADYYLHKTAAHIDELLEKVEGLNNYDDTEVRGLINNKVDKETGKGLSTNDYTNADKAKLDGLDTALNGKVDKEIGKGLSTNDYTTSEKTKLNGIESGANVNVQADWNQTTTTADDYIKNKPTIPDAQIQSDWNQTNTESKDFIKNKPTLGSAASKNYTASITSDSNDLVTSGAVYSAVSTKADLVDGKVPASQLPSYVDDVVEYASVSAFPVTGESGKIYISTDTNKTYRWSGSGYTEISESLALGETASTAYAGNKGKANADAIAAIKDGTNIDSFADVETALALKANTADIGTAATVDTTTSITPGGTGLPTSGAVYTDQQRQDTEIVSLVDRGAKNLSTIDSINYTGESAGWKTADLSSNIASGTYKISCDIERPSGSVANVQVWCKYTDDTTEIVISNTQAASVVRTITFSKNVKQLSIYCTSTATVKNIMICTVDDYAASNVYVPYAKSNYELTQDVEPIPSLVDRGAKNLLHVDNVYVLAAEGVTFVVNPDGTISTNGTATGDTFCSLALGGTSTSDQIYIDRFCDGNHILAGCPAGGNYDDGYSMYAASGSYLRVDEGNGILLDSSVIANIRIIIMIRQGTNADGLVFKPMICTAEDYKASSVYQPYALPNTTITPALIKQVNEGAKNLAKFDIWAKQCLLVRGTKTINGNGSITITATSSDCYTLFSPTEFPVECRIPVTPGTEMVATWEEAETGTGNKYIYFFPNGSASGLIAVKASDEVETFTVPADCEYLTWRIGCSTSGNTVTFNNLMICSAADYAVSSAYVPYAPTNRELYNDVNVLNQRIESFVYNQSTSKSIILSRASSATFLALGFVQGIGNIYWILEIDGSGNLTVKNGFDGSTVSAAGISFNKDTKTLTFTSQYNGNSNITIIMTSV